MDYEVSLLSRICEIYDETGDNTAAVAGGPQRTGDLITSLALRLLGRANWWASRPLRRLCAVTAAHHHVYGAVLGRLPRHGGRAGATVARTA